MVKFQKQVEVQGTKKLDSVKGVQALSLNEMKEIEGGKIPWNKVVKYGRRALEAIGVIDAINDFVEGWNSVDCGCK